MAMTEPFVYISHARLECRDGYRRAYLGDVPEPVTYGVQGARERQGRYRGGGLGRDDDRG